MMKKVFLTACATCVFALLTQPVQAQQWTAEEMEVWETIHQLWELEAAEDDAWKDLIHPSFQSWSYHSPMPYDKEHTVHLVDAEIGLFKVLAQDILPVAIVIVDGTAVAHFYHTTLVEHSDGDQELFEGRSTDILVRTPDGWRFVSWVGDEIGESED